MSSLPAHSQSCEHHESDHMTTLPKQPLQWDFTKDSPFPSHRHHPTSYMPGQSCERCMGNHMTTLPGQPPKGHCAKNMQSPSHEHHPSSNMTSLPTQHLLLPRTKKRSMHHSSRNSMDKELHPSMHFSDRNIFKIKSPTKVTRHLPNFNSLHPCITTCNPNRASTSHTKTAGRTLRTISLSSDSSSIKQEHVPSSVFLTANTSPSGDQAKPEQNRVSLKLGTDPSPKMNGQVRQPSSGGEGCSLMEQNNKGKQSSEIAAKLEPLPQSAVDSSLLMEAEPQDPELAPCKASVFVDSSTQTFNVESKAIQTESEMLAPAVCEGKVESRISETCRKCEVEASMPSELAEGACASVRGNDGSGDGCGGGRITISRTDLQPPLEKSSDSTLLLHDCLPSAIAYSTCTMGGEVRSHHTHTNKLTQIPVTTDTVNIGSDTLFASSLLNADSFTHDLHRHRRSSLVLESSGRFCPGQGEYEDARLDCLDGGGVKMTRSVFISKREMPI